jgi:hypothetical protein
MCFSSLVGVLLVALAMHGCGDSAPACAPDAGGQDGAAGTGANLDGGQDGAADTGADPDAGDASVSDAARACEVQIAQHPDEGANHVNCTPVPTYKTKPPSSGNHYPSWADFKTYDKPVPWGHLVHSLEHGAVVIVYNCPGGCPDEVAAAQAMIDALPVDVLCTGSDKRRVILAPDPTLDVRWAAAAWTWTLRASCFDTAAFSDFAKAHYNHAGENFCSELHEPFCDVL